MKKISFIILTLICFQISVSAQSFEHLKINISNTQLSATLDQYTVYLKQWSVDNKEPNYVISVDQDKLKDNTIFTFNAIVYKNLIERYNASCYTTINGIVVLFHSGLESFIDANPGFGKYITATYWKHEESEDEKKYYEDIKKQKFPKNAEPVPYVELRGIALPKSWILMFKGQQLISTTADLHQLVTQ